MSENETELPDNDPRPPHDTEPEPESTTSEKESIRVSQEEYLDDTAPPSKDKSEYEAEKADKAEQGAH